MHCQSRREFMVRSATAAGAMALGTGGIVSSALAQDKPVEMTIAKWDGAPNPTNDQIKQIVVKLTEKAIEGLGGMKRFVKQGDVVWVKPNIAWDRSPEQAANTNPEVVATLIRLCFEAGAKRVKVGDNPVHQAKKSYEASGIAAAAKAAGAEVVYLDKERFKEVDIKGQRVKSIPIYPDMLEVDLMINVPIAKHHVLATATLGMKNYMGVIENRRVFHQDFNSCLSDITRFMRPKLCVLDAVRVLVASGPTGGRLEDVRTKLTVAAGTDIVALDALGVELIGRKLTDVPHVPAAEKNGLGKSDYRSLALREIAVS